MSELDTKGFQITREVEAALKGGTENVAWYIMFREESLIKELAVARKALEEAKHAL